MRPRPCEAGGPRPSRRRSARAWPRSREGARKPRPPIAEAFALWNALDSPIDHAYTAIDAITLLPDDPVSVEAAAQARARLEELGAMPLLKRLTMAEHPERAEAQ